MSPPCGSPETLADVEAPQATQHQQSPPRNRSPANSPSKVDIVAPNISPIESLDYEVVDNDLMKKDLRSNMRGPFQYILMKWTFCFVIGVIVSLVGFLNNIAIQNIAGFKFVIISKMILAKRFWVAFIVFVCSNLVLILLASVITAYIAPEAAGSGIPEVKAYLNGVDNSPAIFSFSTLFVKIVGNIFGVSSSVYIGKAGPMVHIGACIAAIVGEGGSNKLKLNWKWLNLFKNDRDRRDFVTCGSAAGLAAAFRAPIGGVLFTLQEMASWGRSALLWQAFFTVAVVALVLRALISMICLRGECGLFGRGSVVVYGVTSANVSYQLKDVPLVAILALIGGILGSLYNFLLNKTLTLFYKPIYKKGNVHKVTLACFISIFTSCVLFGLPWLAPCHPCPPDSPLPCPTTNKSVNYRMFRCPPSHYNDLASLLFNTKDDAIRNLFSKDTQSEFHFSSVLIFFTINFMLSALSYGIAAPAGLFVPIILIGASYGRLFGMCVAPLSSLNHGLFAVLGSASLLGGSMRMTVSLCALILEITGDLLLLPLIMMVALVSKAVGDEFDRNIYDMMIISKGLPYMVDNSETESYMRELTAGDMMTAPVKVFGRVEKVGNVVCVLRDTGHNGFPVVDHDQTGDITSSPLLYGLILRAHLIMLLKKKMFVRTSTDRLCQDAMVQFAGGDCCKNGVGIEDVEVSEEEMKMFLDLHPFTNTSPYTVVETMSLLKAFRLFRELGLRHLLVIPSAPQKYPVVGVLTRHDFMAQRILKLHPRLLPNKSKTSRF